MKTSIVRICSAVAINIKGGRPLCASPSSDHFVSYNCYFYGSFKPGFIVRREDAPGTEAEVARPQGQPPLRAPARAPCGPGSEGWDGGMDAGEAAVGCWTLVGYRARAAARPQRGECGAPGGRPAKPGCEDLSSCRAEFLLLS